MVSIFGTDFIRFKVMLVMLGASKSDLYSVTQKR